MRDDVDEDDARPCSSSLSTASNTAHSNPRASRNLAEKQRRDNLNTQIATMASLVPSVSSGTSRKKDKISVLRLSAAHLRMAYTLGTQSNEFLPRQFNSIDLENSLIDTVSGNLGFLLVLTTGGKIIYISRHVEQHLGHEQIDMIGDSLYNYVYADDHEELTIGLTPDNTCPSITNTDSLEETSNSSEESSSRTEYRNFRPQRRNFYIRMSQRTNSRRETVQYEYLLVSGVLRLAYECKNQESNGTRGRREHTATNNDIIFVGNARLLMKRRIAELSLLEANKNEYFTRHLVDGRIIFCDHRISIVAGYMSEEVSGTSAFKFMHKDDVRWTIVALRHMYEYGNYGSSCYRLITKTGEFIYLRTHGYLEYDETTQSVTSFICINTLTSKEEGDKLIAEMKKRYSATINSKMVKAIRGDNTAESDSECPSLEDATELEDAITQMINDLPSPVRNDDRLSPTPLPDTQLVKAVVYSKQLPPASIQASKIGIKDSWPYSGKGGKDEKRKQESSAKNIVESGIHCNNKNGERMTFVSEKRMPELEDSFDQKTKELKIPSAKKALTSTDNDSYIKLCQPEYTTIKNTSCYKSSNESSTFNLQANHETEYLQSDIQLKEHSLNLKRPYEYDDTDGVSKKKTSQNLKPENIINVDNYLTCTNEEINYPTYIQVQTDTDLNQIQTSYSEDATNTVTISNLNNHYIDIQELSNEELLKNTIENNSEILKLFSSLPPALSIEGDLEEVNIHQYPTNDQGALVENDGRHMHLLMSESVSSCESQFSDLGVAHLQAHCDNLTQVHNVNSDSEDQGLVTKHQTR